MVISKELHNKLITELTDRYSNLQYLLVRKELDDNSDGLSGKKRWKFPHSMCKTSGDKLDLDFAISDFKTVLNELSRLNK